MDAGLVPGSGHQHHGTDHGRNTGGIGNCLRSHLFITFLMITYIVEIIGLVFAVFLSLENTADVGFSLCAWAKGSRIRKDCF